MRFQKLRSFTRNRNGLTLPGLETLLVAVMGILVSTSRGDELVIQGQTANSGRGMVVTVSRPASEVGQKILDAGGNAVDAAVAVGFALAVTWPEAGNIGGGGFMLVYPTNGTPPSVIDYRERAPSAATVDMFAQGDVSDYLRVGVPGTVRGFQMAHQRFGRLSWDAVVQPSVHLARDGFEVSSELAISLNAAVDANPDRHDFQKAFGPKPGKTKWKAGDVLVQSDLADTLNMIATEGADAFYTGRIAIAIEDEMKRGGGLITKLDLAEYRAMERTPVRGTYRGFDLFSSPPPSSGGTALIQMLNTAEEFDLRNHGRWSPYTLHILIESMRRAYCDRARYLGDPEFNQLPNHLVTKEYAKKLKEKISPTSATASSVLGADILRPEGGPHTTHFSIIDQDGMAVSNTYTLEGEFGSRIVVRGCGFLLNDEMSDFNPKPGVTDAKGLIGTKPNLIAPGKRMLSSMCPTIVTKNGRVVLVTGSPGGRTIINTVFCVVINVLEFEMPLREAIDAPRMHQAWMPDKVQMEAGLFIERTDAVEQLRKMGHLPEENAVGQGDAHSIFVDTATGRRFGVVDSRRSGWAAGQK